MKRICHAPYTFHMQIPIYIIIYKNNIILPYIFDHYYGILTLKTWFSQVYPTLYIHND